MCLSYNYDFLFIFLFVEIKAIDNFSNQKAVITLIDIYYTVAQITLFFYLNREY